ncbi:MAG: DUF2225 domain-containing protein [Deltaproteobacteria bacterium]|nr:DUF2225 domain-containing protein [Deltaproteobacteria bacterium]
MYFALASCILAVLLLNQSALALTFMTKEFVCPLDGTKFRAEVIASQFIAGIRTDMRRTGAVAEPPPLPVCPTDGLILFKETFNDEEKAKLRRLVQSAEYKNAKDGLSYFLLAKIFEHLGMPNNQTAHAYLSASWQVENAGDSKRLNKYLQSSLRHLKKHIESSKDASEVSLEDQLLAGELERRLGQFEEAKERFDSLSAKLDRVSHNHREFYRRLMGLQLQLIQKKDDKPRVIPN